MPSFYPQEDMDSDEDDDYILDTINDNYCGRYLIDTNYNRPLKNFPQTLNKIDEVDETSLKSPEGANQDENGNKVEETRRGVAWNLSKDLVPISHPRGQKERPKSASCVSEEPKEKIEKRPRSSCAGYPSKIPVKKKDAFKNNRSDSDCSSGLSVEEEESRWRHKEKRRAQRYREPDQLADNYATGEEFVSFHENYPLRPKSACSVRKDDYSQPVRGNSSTKRCNSQPNIAREESPPAPWSTWCEVTRFKRSLKLLGLSNSDFGLPDSPKKHAIPQRPRSSAGSAPTFSTRVLQRSISLDCLREVVRDSACSPCTGLPQRRLLAQAAYEEWYFKKCEETSRKVEEERTKSEKLKEAMEIEELTRRAKASEHYMKWMEKKKADSSKNAPKKLKLNPQLESRLKKNREEIDKAYLEWKRKKKHDPSTKKKQQEQEKAVAEKARKEEKKKLAEKVFLEWKKKLEEAERVKRAKENQMKAKIKEQLTARSKSSTSFQTWKEQKDGELKIKSKKLKEAIQKADDIRSMTLSERQYEAEQAFDEWLDKVDGRSLTNATKKSGPRSIQPWAPS